MMEKAVNFITKYYDGFLATSIEGQPRIRPFHFMYFESGKFYFCTGVKKHVYIEMNANPFVEFCSENDNMSWIRVRGNVHFTNDLKVKEKIINASEIVKDVYKSAENEDLIAFYIDHGEVLFSKNLFDSEYFKF